MGKGLTYRLLEKPTGIEGSEYTVETENNNQYDGDTVLDRRIEDVYKRQALPPETSWLSFQALTRWPTLRDPLAVTGTNTAKPCSLTS